MTDFPSCAILTAEERGIFMNSVKVDNGYAYEEYVARELKRRGFRRVRQTPRSRDYGVDLLAEYNGVPYAVQCKYYTRPVDGSAVQEAVAGMGYYGCERTMVVCNTTFTPAARALAEANGVELLENLSPRPDFWSRRRPWELVLLAVQCVVFGLVLREMVAQHSLTPKGVGMLALLCFLASYLAVRLGLLLSRAVRKKKTAQDR